MSITDRQKKIINPYAESFETSERHGVGYDYSSRRNRFIQDAIQEKYIYFFQFPKAGDLLRVKAEDAIENPEIQIADLLAYFALYPQNGKVIGGEAVEIGDDEARGQLQILSIQLSTAGVLDKYTSKTSEVSYLEEYQGRQDIANLIAVPPAHSNKYRNKLRQAFDLPDYQYSGEVDLASVSLSSRASTYVITDTNVDLYDWRQNCLPGEKDKTYYNTVDRNYYFTRRTDDVDLGYLNYSFNAMRAEALSPGGLNSAQANWNSTSEEGKTEYTTIVNNAIKVILQSTGKYSTENYQLLVDRYSAPNRFVLYTDKSLRPGSRWTYAIKISGQDIENLPSPDSIDPSLEETEISTLEKAKRIISKTNTSVNTIQFQVEDLIRYIFLTRSVLREYDKRLFDLNLGPDRLNGIDLEKEVDRLNSFFSLLELFYSYNKIAIQDTDFVQMYFTDDYQLNHLIINGSFYYQGTGGRTYLNEAVESARVINAFGILTPTTFSIIKNSQQIYNESTETSNDNRREVLDFISEYLFPQIDREAIAKKQGEVSRLEKERSARRKKIFETYGRLTKGDPKDFESIWENRPLRYQISSTLNNMNCDTGQVAAARYALKFWKAWDSKTRVQSLIRQAIILIRDEVIDDETNKRRLSDTAYYAQNPDRVGRDVERYINSQIFCSLDVIGDFVEDQFLDPLGLPPEANRLTRSTISSMPKIEFKKCSMTSSKARQSVLYQKMLETILLNFIKSIVAGIVKDVIKALLGCGPNDPETELPNNFRKEDYGFVNLNELLYGIDITEIARTVGIKNVEEQNIDGNITVNTTDVTEEQLTPLIRDISLMTTPVEIQQLLNGDASNDLLEHILETVKGNKDIDTGPVNIDVDIYNMMNLSVDRIRNYFLAIGMALNGTLDNLGEMGFLSPLEAYCNKKDGFINPLTFDFSVPEIEAQYNDIVSSKIDKINNLCSFLKDLTNIELEIQRLIDSLPILDWYNQKLQDLADLSNQFTEWIAKKFSELFGEEQKTRQQPEYNLYNSDLGTQLFYQIFFSLREVLINQLYFDGNGTTYFQTPAGFNGNRVGFHGAISENFWSEDDRIVQGNFGGRKNLYTRNNVYKFIWSDSRQGNFISPGRINLPQYRDPIVPPSDVYDAAYYSLRNSPGQLIKNLKISPNLLSPNMISRINYGESRANNDVISWRRLVEAFGNLGADKSEFNYLLILAGRVYNYLKQVENSAPYEGWTGATYLKGPNEERPNATIFYNSKPSGQLDEVSAYNVQQDYNEISENSNTIAIDNQNYDVVDYRIYRGLEYNGSSIIVNDEDVLIIDEVKMPWYRRGNMITLYSNYSIGLPLLSTPNNTPLWERMRDAIPHQNYTTRIDTLINNSVINDIGKRRMPRYIAALNKPSLQKTDDICVTAEDILKGEAGLRKVQANLFSFFMNIMPMASAYPNWRSGGTVEMITDYLTRKLIEDLKDKQILGSFYELIPFIKMVYPHFQNDEEFNKNPLILDELSPLENTRNIIKSVYVGTLDNISETSEYGNINKSIFDPSSTLNTYKRMLGNFYRTLYNAEDLQNFYLPEGQDVVAVREQLATLYTGNDLSQPSEVTDKGMLLGTYYFPIAFQIASYMIYMDRGIRYSERYRDTKYRMMYEEAGSDDAVLTANKGELINRFSPTYLGFPIINETWNGVPVNYYNSMQSEKRIIVLDQLIDSFESEEGFGYLKLYDPDDLGNSLFQSLAGENQQQLLKRQFPDFFDIDAILGANKLYPDIKTPTVSEAQDILSAMLPLATVWLSSLRSLILNDVAGFRDIYTAGSSIETEPKFPSFGPVFNTTPTFALSKWLLNLGDDEADQHLRNIKMVNTEEVILEIDSFNQQFGNEILLLTPTIRTNIEYFTKLGDIFRNYATVMHKSAAERFIGRDINALVHKDLYPYYLFPSTFYDNVDPETGNIQPDERQTYINNLAFGHTQRFFQEYLYNKYFNYRTNKAKILEEKNQLEKLINRNE